jgi:hypothetical protein
VATKITKIQVRRDSADNWTTANPTLSVGEIGFEQDSYRFKIGYDNLDWATLPYFSGQGILSNSLKEVLQRDNNGQGFDILVDGVNIKPVVTDGQVVSGGISGQILPTDTVTFVKDGVITEYPIPTGKPTLGDDFNRFPQAFLEGAAGDGEDFLVFGKQATITDSTGSGTLSYKKAPTKYAVVTVTEVAPLTGEILEVGFASTVLTGLSTGEGYYEFKGVPGKYVSTNDPNNPNAAAPGSGFGVRFDINSVVAPTDSIGDLVVTAGGVGYEKNEELIVALPGHIIANYEGFERRIISSLVTQEDLSEITTDSISTSRENLIQFNGDEVTRGLPSHGNDLTTQGKVNGWFWESLVYHEYVKPTVRDCVANGPEEGGVIDPKELGNTDFLRYDINPLSVINVQGVDKPETDPAATFFHADWGNYVGGKQAFGGEILIWDPALAPDPTGGPVGNTGGAWNFAFRPRTDATIPLEETDPIFVASAAYNIKGKDYSGLNLDTGLPTETVTNHPMYKRESGALEPLMMVNNWKAIGRL